MKLNIRSLVATAVVANLAIASALVAQDPAPASTGMQLPPINISGVVFGNYKYEGGKPNQSTNSFNLDRAYVTAKATLSDRLSARVTLDIFNSGTAGAGYTYRAKYAYLNYTYFQNTDIKADARVGVVQTAPIENLENFFPRYIAKSPDEQAGFMKSADVGAATFISLPSKMGEIYLGVANGNGYDNPTEADRFKDYSARLLLTPMASSTGFLKGLAIQGYYYKGDVASTFVNGGIGQVGPVNDGVKKDRVGVLVGLRDPRYTVAFDWAQAMQEIEGGANTTLSPRTVADNTARLMSGMVTLNPFQMMNSASTMPVGIVARYDRVKPNTNIDDYSNFIVAGLTFDLTKKAQFALDYQEMTGHNGFVVTPARTYYAHWIVNF